MLQRFDPRNRDLLVNINGRLVHRNQASVSPFDSSVQGGDAVWEGLRLYEGKIFRLTAHLARLRDSAHALGFTEIPDAERIVHELRRTLEANFMWDAVHVRLTLTRGVKLTSGMDPRLNQSGPTLIVLAEHKFPVYQKTGLSLITSSIRRPPPDCLDPKIHHNNLLPSILAKIEANAAGADDALMLDTQGFVAETNATNLFLVRNGVVFTPFCKACPEGITRDTVMRLCASNDIEAREADLSVMEFYRADEVFCTGTMGELAPIAHIDGRRIAEGKPGPITERLSELFSQEVQRSGEVIMEAPPEPA